MAEVYATVNGKKLTRLIALHRTVQLRLESETLYAGQTAEAILRDAKEPTNTAQIAVETGKIDKYVILDDTRGLLAAMTIEYGREGGNLDKNGKVVSRMEPVAPLHRAFEFAGNRALDRKARKKGGDSLE